MVITANGTSSTSVVLTWKPLEKKQRNGILLGYKVFIICLGQRERQSVELPPTNKTVDANTTSLEIQYLLKYTVYCFRILAFTTVGDGSMSECVRVRTAEDGKISCDSLPLILGFGPVNVDLGGCAAKSRTFSVPCFRVSL